MNEVIYYGRTGSLKNLGEQLTDDARAFQAEGYEISEIHVTYDAPYHHLTTEFSRPANYEELKRQERAIISEHAHTEGFEAGFDAALDQIEEMFNAIAPGIFAAARGRSNGLILAEMDLSCDCPDGECILEDTCCADEISPNFDDVFDRIVEEACCSPEKECGDPPPFDCVAEGCEPYLPLQIGYIGPSVSTETLDRLIAVLDKTLDVLAEAQR